MVGPARGSMSLPRDAMRGPSHQQHTSVGKELALLAGIRCNALIERGIHSMRRCLSMKKATLTENQSILPAVGTVMGTPPFRTPRPAERSGVLQAPLYIAVLHPINCASLLLNVEEFSIPTSVDLQISPNMSAQDLQDAHGLPELGESYDDADSAIVDTEGSR